MKLFMTGFKNISKPTLTSYLINYYYINVYNYKKDTVDCFSTNIYSK